jgi:hypothetical protein
MEHKMLKLVLHQETLRYLSVGRMTHGAISDELPMCTQSDVLQCPTDTQCPSRGCPPA